MKHLVTLCLLLATSMASAQLEALRTLTPEQGQEVRRPIEALIFGSTSAALSGHEAVLLEIFQSSETTLEGKKYSCRMLRHCASATSIPVLAPKLTDPELSHYVCLVLQGLNTPEVDLALITALSAASPEQKIGIIGSLGQRGSEKSVKASASYLSDSPAELQFAALTALGDIGGNAAANVLAKAQVLPQFSNALKLARMRVAEDLPEKQAAEIFMEYRLDSNEHVQVVSLIGMTHLAPEKFTAEVLSILDSRNPQHRRAAIGLLPQLPTDALIASLTEQSPENQIILMSELSDRHAEEAEESVICVLTDENKPLQEAVFTTLGHIGGIKSATLLIPLSQKNTAAYKALCSLNAAGADEAIIQTLIRSKDDAVQVKMIECLTARQAKIALPSFMEIAKGDWSRTRAAAIAGMASLVSENDFAPYAELMLSANQQKKITALEKSVIIAAQRQPDADQCALPFIKVFGMAKGENAYAIIGALGGIGGESARVLLTQALLSPDPEIKDAAIRGLANWPSLDAADQLLEIATTAETASQQVLAIRGYIRLAGTVKDPALNLKMCKKAAAATDRTAELKSIIGCAKRNRNQDVLNFLTTQLDNPEVFTEAGWSICEISSDKKLKKSSIPALERIARCDDKKLADAAQKQLVENQK
jgi:HEAT repeat protein